jgi:hypothetical protein
MANTISADWHKCDTCEPTGLSRIVYELDWVTEELKDSAYQLPVNAQRKTELLTQKQTLTWALRELGVVNG